jgi:ABC-type multidrug transport system ATPase subunit
MVYKRQKEQLTQEFFNTVMYFAVLILSAFTATTTNTPYQLEFAGEGFFVNSTAVAHQICYDRAKKRMNKCYVAFGNTEAGNGCTPKLEAFILTNLSMCQTGDTPLAGLPVCKCARPQEFSDLAFVKALHEGRQLASAVEFGSEFSDYTLHIPGIGISTSTSLYTSPLAGPNILAQNFERGIALPLQVALDSAISGVDISVNVERFPQEGFKIWTPGGLMNFPFYVCMLIMFGVMVLTTHLVEDGHKGLRQGLFMLGLDPVVYWLSWMQLLAARQMVTVVLTIAITKLLLLEYASAAVLLLLFLLYALYSILLAICFGQLNFTPQAATQAISMLPMLCAALSYVYTAQMNQPAAQITGPPVPRWATLSLSFVLAPFAFTMSLTNTLAFENEVDRGSGIHNIMMNANATGVSTLEMIIALLVGNCALGAFAYWRSIATRGIAKVTASAPAAILANDNEADLESGSITQDQDGTCQDGKSAGPRVAVSIRNLKKHFGELKAVDGLTVDFYAGQITAFLGHNGAGKTTTIQTLTGLYNVTEGDALIEGISVARHMRSVRPLIGVCPQENVLWDSLTVHDHMLLFAAIRNAGTTAPVRAGTEAGAEAKAVMSAIAAGGAVSSNEREITMLLSQVGLKAQHGTLAKALSGGMKRKLCVAIALIGSPKVLFLDEPTAGMDAQARRDMWSLLLSRRENACIVLCTHHMDEADILGDRVAVIDAGKLQEAGTPAELKARYGKGLHLSVSVSAGTDRQRLMKMVAANGGEGVKLDLSDVAILDEEMAAQVTAERLKLLESGDLNLLLPTAGSTDIPRVLEALDGAKRANGEGGGEGSSLLGVKDFGIVAVTLEDVFWELDQASERANEDATAETLRGGGGAEGGYGGAGVRGEMLIANTEYEIPTFTTKIGAIVRRRVISFSRNWSAMRGMVPTMGFLTMGILLASVDFMPTTEQSVSSISIGPEHAFNGPGKWLPYRDTTGGYTSAAMILPRVQQWSMESGGRLPQLLDAAKRSPCFKAFLINEQDPAACGSTASAASEEDHVSIGSVAIVGALEFGPSSATSSVVYTVLPNSAYLFSLSAIVALANSAIYTNQSINQSDLGGASYSSTGSIQPKLQQFPVEPKTAEEERMTKMVAAQITSIAGTIPFIFGVLMVPAMMAYFVAEDQTKQIKQLQILMGVTPTEYWVSQALGDMLYYLAVMLLPVIVAFTTRSPLVGKDGASILLLLAYPGAVAPMTYLLASTCKKPSTAYGVCMTANNGLFFVTFLTYCVLAMPALGIGRELLEALRWLFCCNPTTALALGLRAVILADAYGYNAYGVDEAAREQFALLPVETALVPLLFLIVEAVVLTTIVVAVDSRNAGDSSCLPECLNQYLCRCVGIGWCYKEKKTRGGGESSSAESKKRLLQAHEVEDEDVQAERDGCDSDARSAGINNWTMARGQRSSVNQIGPRSDSAVAGASEQDTMAVHMHHLKKQYRPAGKQRYKADGTVAVHDMCLRVRERECFSLLGTNGAGKTTTLSMLMRQLAPTGGACYIRGQDIYRLGPSAHLGFGFCPQANALFDTLTTTETLGFYSAVRGVPAGEVRTKYVRSWLEAAQLVAFAETRCAKLSGGNKRKLSLAIAILGNPKLAVLDEPSAGVDPAARKKLHRIINGVKARGTTVVLTTHNMAEASKLGDRIGIMVQGRLACIGSPQHLLSRYSSGYVLTIAMCSGRDVAETVLPLLHRLCPDHKVTNQPTSEYCSVRLGSSSSFPLVELYRSMQELQRERVIEFFTCGQSNLESVFLRFARLTDENDDGNSTTAKCDSPVDGQEQEGVAVTASHGSGMI